MRSIRTSFLAVFVGLSLSGCHAVTDAYMVDSLTTGKKYKDVDEYGLLGTNKQTVPLPFDLETECLPTGPQEDAKCPTDPNPGPHPRLTAYQLASQNKDGRNRVMGFLIQRSNLICDVHKAAIIANASSTNLFLGEATTILSGLGAVISPESAAKALSGSATIVNGTRAQINEVVYQNMLATAVVKSIEQTQKTAMDSLSAKRDKEINEYTADEMVADVVNYHTRCSFYEGMVTLTDAAAHINPSSTELTARIDALQKQIDGNLTELSRAEKPDQDALKAANTNLRASISQLQAQLGSAYAQGK